MTKPPEPENGTAQAQPGENTGAEDQTAATIATLTETVQKLTAAFGTLKEDVIRLRKDTRKPREPKATDPKGASNGAAEDELPAQGDPAGGFLTQWDLLDLLSDLPPDARKEVREILEGGGSPQDAQRAAAFIKKGMGFVENTNPPNGGERHTPGRAESAPTQRGAGSQRFKSYEQWRKWREKVGDQEALSYLDRNPTFDEDALPGSPAGGRATVPMLRAPQAPPSMESSDE